MASRVQRLLSKPMLRSLGFAAWTGGAFSAGYALRRNDEAQSTRMLPSGWRACCDGVRLTKAQEALRPQLEAIVGAAHVQSAVEQHGSRLGRGVAFAVVRPGTLQQCVECVQACVDADVAVLPQGANTGLTGGSVPRGAEKGNDRPTVVINMARLDAIIPIDEGQRLVCLAGAGIHSALQKAAAIGRESHSVLGSIFLNPTTAAGVAFGSGGTQLRKGPVYTERLLYVRVNEQGKAEVVNTLGLRGTQSQQFAKLESGTLCQDDVDGRCTLPASERAYGERVCACDGHAGKAVARFNASTAGPPPNRSEGKVLILASVHDTFPSPRASEVLWISLRDLAAAQQLKRHVCLSGGARDLPTSCEYMDKDALTAVDEAGRVMCYVLSLVGIGKKLKQMWDLKLTFEGLPLPFAPVIADKALFFFNRLFPCALPAPIQKMAAEYEHHLLVEVGDFGGGEADRFMARLKEFEATHPIAVHKCSAAEQPWVKYFRFAAAPAFRTWCIGMGLEGVSVDYALPKGECDAPPLPEEMAALRMRYSHFGCNVVHEDIAFRPGVDAHEAKMSFKHAVEAMGGKLPAEHGHGTEYAAPEDAQRRWQQMDPLNVFNPGVGGLSGQKRYGKSA
ncbi:hypothetical protein AB1Y20_007268 [Prymnesium parvum]|uniref:FAD-binding PCMH-type domain-containing protein n=1 Tax=Prymnesium parvum TaxID=97485 RepID=A0AB34IX54_PRYPA